MKSSSSQPDESADPIRATDTAITAALNALYATEDSSLEPQIEALSLEALRSSEWVKRSSAGLREPCDQIGSVSLELLNIG